MKQIRVNVQSIVNKEHIRTERRNGRDYKIVTSATMPDGIVMNRIRYPAEAIANSFSSLEGTPAPLGHPQMDGKFISAKTPEAWSAYGIGAWNRNVRREGGRVYVDKVIDVATAQQLEGGKAVLNAIDKGEPIHTSTGLLAVLNAVEGDPDVDWEATEISFDHDAILLGERGAATPEQGVGMMVNAAQGEDGKEIDVVNSSISESIDADIDWNLEQISRALERKERLPLLEKLKAYISELFKGEEGAAALDEVENENVEEQVKELANQVAALTEAFGKVGDVVKAEVANAVKPIVDAEEAKAAAAKAAADAEHLTAVNAVVKTGLLTEEEAKAAPLAVLNALVAKEKATPAHRIANGYKATESNGFLLPEGD